MVVSGLESRYSDPGACFFVHFSASGIARTCETGLRNKGVAQSKERDGN
jgi:hypothetical protein